MITLQLRCAIVRLSRRTPPSLSLLQLEAHTSAWALALDWYKKAQRQTSVSRDTDSLEQERVCFAIGASVASCRGCGHQWVVSGLHHPPLAVLAHLTLLASAVGAWVVPTHFLLQDALERGFARTF
jgi:hypothetical protein